jgi:hypothetical protein
LVSQFAPGYREKGDAGNLVHPGQHVAKTVAQTDQENYRKSLVAEEAMHSDFLSYLPVRRHTVKVRIDRCGRERVIVFAGKGLGSWRSPLCSGLEIRL